MLSLPTHILDVDGFVLGTGFQCKELACVEVDTGVLYSEAFRLDGTFDDLSAKDRRTASYVTRHVHGMRYENTDDETYGQKDVDDVVAWMLTRRGSSNIVVGYKSGHLEQQLAQRLGLPSVDLRWLGCPRFEQLLNMVDNRMELHATYGDALRCDMHRYIEPRTVAHCPRLEVVVFREWYIRNNM